MVVAEDMIEEVTDADLDWRVARALGEAEAAEAMDTVDFERVLLSGVPSGDAPLLLVGVPNIPITLRMNGFCDPCDEALDLPPTGVVGPPDIDMDMDIDMDIDIDLIEDAALLLLRDLVLTSSRDAVGVTTAGATACEFNSSSSSSWWLW